MRRLALIACFMQFVSGARSSAGVGELASCCLEPERQACLLFALLFSRVTTALLVPQAGKRLSVRHPPSLGLCRLAAAGVLTSDRHRDCTVQYCNVLKGVVKCFTAQPNRCIIELSCLSVRTVVVVEDS